METRLRFCLSALLLSACSAQSTPQAAEAPADTGPEAQQALALARVCATGEPWNGLHEGYCLTLAQATAHRDASSQAHFRVRIPEGFYLGRLPPLRPPEAVWMRVDLARKACSPL